MKNWKEAEVVALDFTKTADPKPSCTGEGNGTCDFWCNGDNGKRSVCPYNGGFCKKALNDTCPLENLNS